MMSVDPFICHSVDRLIRGGCAVALYRLPHERICRLLVRRDGIVSTFGDIRDLNGKRGFVIAPFCPGPEYPVVLIEPQAEAGGEERIRSALKEIDWKNVSVPAEIPVRAGISDDAADFKVYEKRFNTFIGPLIRGACDKLVLSRCSGYPLPLGFSPARTFFKACGRYPEVTVALFHTRNTGTWLGSTPECLLSGNGTTWRSVALAGTGLFSEGEGVQRPWSPKNLREQGIVADYIREVLRRFSKKVRDDPPETVCAGHLVHLKTDFTFEFEKRDRLGDLLAALHPTPAVCGLPKDFAQKFIREHERLDRKYFTGFFGRLDPGEQTDLFVNLRCAELTPGRATLYAGGGILATSACLSEWNETVEKMNTLNVLLNN